MCFSASASFVSGGVLSALGVLAIKKTKFPHEKMIASVPFIFGIQQIIEGFIWINSNEIQTPSGIVTFGPKVLTYGYLFFAMILWPTFLPISIGLIELKRKKKILILTLPAAITSLYFTWVLFKYPIYSQIQENHIQYHFTIHPSLFIVTTYCLATILPCLLSSHRWIVGVGAVLTVALLFSKIYFDDAFASIWCFFSALLSAFIYIHFAIRERTHQRALPKNALVNV